MPGLGRNVDFTKYQGEPDRSGLFDQSPKFQDTGWIDVGSTRVQKIRFVPNSNDPYMGTLYVRFHKYRTAYAYRGVPRPTAEAVRGMGMAKHGIGSYINSVLDGFSRDYCSDAELMTYFDGDGGSYRGPGR